jgi:hypothetical protein
MFFTHLKNVKQSYFQHFYDSFYYSFICWKASSSFLFHALWPDSFEFSGSNEIERLNTLLKDKKRNLLIENAH